MSKLEKFKQLLENGTFLFLTLVSINVNCQTVKKEDPTT